jgi:hypothetical protein
VSQNVIELNGKRYDAITGDLLGPSTAGAVSHLAAKHTSTPAASGRVVDGFFRGAKAAHTPAPAAKKNTIAKQDVIKVVRTVRSPKAAMPSKIVTATPVKPAAKPVSVAAKITAKPITRPKPRSASEMHAPVTTKPAATKKEIPTTKQHHAGHAHLRDHTPAKPAARHEVQHSKTLMRSAVQRPNVRMKPAIKTQAPAELAAAPASSLMKRSVTAVDPSRAERAKSALRNSSIQRFHVAHYGTTPVKHTVHHSGTLPVIPVKSHPIAAAAPVKEPIHHSDIFENAIKHAHSHEQPLHHPHMRKHRRFINIAAGIAVLFVLGGFIAYTNLPNIQLHIASVEAGFHASMPSYAPTGYALRGGVHHSGGTVSMSYVSGDSAYQITQQSSNWDSQALLDNTLALSGPHRTIERSGRTVYIYDGSNASWVTGNVRYDITGTASLSAEELASIAASM